jgi:beta-glucanase (GH16 family)
VGRIAARGRRGISAILTGAFSILVAAVIVGAPVGASSAGIIFLPSQAPAPAPTATNCQGTTPLGLSGDWSCTFDDEFNGSALNTNLWVPQLTATSGYVAGPDCYVDTPQTVSVSGGYLNLSVVPASNYKCTSNYTSNYIAGMVSTRGKFTQTYGAFEVNAKLPAATVGGLQETFWLYPETNTYGAWPDSGEIDFGEFFSAYPLLDVPYIHYSASSKDPFATTDKCTITPSQFNTYGVDWTPTSISILYDGQVCLVDHPMTGSEPFNKPFFLALTQALGLTGVNGVTAHTPLPATTQIDWVRAWTPTS